MQNHLMDLYYRDVSACADAEDDELAPTSEGLTCEDHDLAKLRATVTQYVALVGEEVAVNLESLACARVEKPKKRRVTDAHVQEAYQKLTSGGGQGDGDVGEDGDAQVAGPLITSERHFPPIQCDFSNAEDMKALLAFEKRARVTAFGKEFLNLLCMDTAIDLPAHTTHYAFNVEQQRHYDELRNLAEDSRAEYDDLVRNHASKTEVNAEEDNIELGIAAAPRTAGPLPNLLPDATFATQMVYEFPSQFIRDLVAAFPPEEKLTRDQVLFVAEFAHACDLLGKIRANHQRNAAYITCFFSDRTAPAKLM